MFCLQEVYKYILEKLTMEATHVKISIKTVRTEGDQGRKTALWLPSAEKEVGLKLGCGMIEGRRQGDEETEHS